MENHVARLTKELSARGHEVTVVVPGRHVPNPEARLLRWGSDNKAIRAALSTADVVHTHASRSVFTARVALGCQAPVVFTPHCFYPATSWHSKAKKFAFDRSLGRAALVKAARVLSLTRADQADAIRLYDLPLTAFRIVPNAVDFTALDAALDVQQGRPLASEYYVFTGRLDANKNAVQLIRVAEQLLGDDRHLVILGPDGGQGEQITRARDGLATGLRKRVHLLGRVSFHELAQWVACSRALILPSRYEGLPTSVLEAVGLGVPCLVSRVGGSAELEGSLSSVTAFRYNDDAELLASADRVPELRRSCAAAREIARRTYSWSVVTSQVESCYAEVLKS